MQDILSLTPSELEAAIASLGHPKFRAAQVWNWLHKNHVQSFADMTNLTKALRSTLEDNFHIATVRVVKTLTSSNDGTTKYLQALYDDALIESVVMQYNYGNTICISTQVGCRMGCVFCASAEGGLVRNLTAGEMCAQVYAAADIKNIVLMGCGEPLDNFDATIHFLELITHVNGSNIGQRHITLSTCGLVPQMLKLAEKKLQITLAISLHGATDDVRQVLMPIAKRYTLTELISACKGYVQMTNRRVTFEYALVRGINDAPSHAKDLIKLLRGINCHVNLIPVNRGRGQFAPTARKEAIAFAEILQTAKIQTTVRRSLGADVDAACGQLRAKGV